MGRRSSVIHPEESTLCVMCNGEDESSLHLFLHCHVAVTVWSKLMMWLNSKFLTPLNLFVHWECWSRRCGNKNRLRGQWLIWNTAIWVLWKARNDKNFKDINYEVDEIVEEIKVLSWRWMLHHLSIPACLYYEWCWDPIYCLGRVRLSV